MNHVLVTGANGFVGNHLVKELSDHGLRVIGVSGEQGSAEKSAHATKYLVLDLNDPAATQEIDFGKVDAVIHLAGLAAVGPSFDEPMRYIDTNIGIEVNLFEAALRQKARPKFLIISSGALYDPKARLPLTEKSAVLPSSPYAVSKLGQEQMSEYYTSRGFDCVIARPFNHIGPGQNPGFIVPDVAQQIVAIERGQAEKVLVGNLDAKRDYTDMRDIARAYRLLIEKGKSGEVYNVCSGHTRSGQQLLDELLKISKVTVAVKKDASKLRPSDNPKLYGSHEKLTNDTGWQPAIELEQTLTDVMTDWRSRE